MLGIVAFLGVICNICAGVSKRRDQMCKTDRIKAVLSILLWPPPGRKARFSVE